MAEQLAGGAVACCQAQAAYRELRHLGDVVEYYAGVDQLAAKGRVKLFVYAADSLGSPEHGMGMVEQAAPHGVVQLECRGIAQQLLPVFPEYILGEHAQVVVRKALRNLYYPVVHLLRGQRRAGHQTGHIHIVGIPGGAYAVYLQLLRVLPYVYRSPDLDYAVRFVYAVLLYAVIPELGGYFAAGISQYHVQIVAALYVALYSYGLDYAKALHLIIGGIHYVVKQVHASHGAILLI